MHIVFDRGKLRFHSDTDDPLHSEALETWRESDIIAQRIIQQLPEEAEALCKSLAETSTHALTFGRDDKVIQDFLKVERKLRSAIDRQRTIALEAVLRIAVTIFAMGLFLGFSWIWIKNISPWSSLPRGFDLAANWILLTAGWSGFTMVGFSVGWLFYQVAILRVAHDNDLSDHARLLSQILGQVIYIILLCFVLNFFLFFFNGFDKINENLSTQLTSSPWAILLGIVAGFIEPTLFDRLRSALKFF